MTPQPTIRPILSTLVLLLTTSCGGGAAPLTGPAPTPPGVSHTATGATVHMDNPAEAVGSEFDATPAEAYAALAAVYEEMNIQVKERDPRAGIIGNQRFVTRNQLVGKPMAHFLDCGMGPGGVTANAARIEMRIRSQVQVAPNGKVTVATAMDALARSMEGTSNTGVQCGSTHRLEQEILTRVGQRLRKSGS